MNIEKDQYSKTSEKKGVREREREKMCELVFIVYACVCCVVLNIKRQLVVDGSGRQLNYDRPVGKQVAATCHAFLALKRIQLPYGSSKCSSCFNLSLEERVKRRAGIEPDLWTHFAWRRACRIDDDDDLPYGGSVQKR
ncbi:hypothetical protein M514_03984 [Trichuris suis]|uniref:Uncharacterized protein n=1 Tax=Trichuris suis TaxID=68888 RepID=A0A085NSY0_9BILA|nr:hypothetical protein M513_03984 [Trichuris suis]KFD72576.1 hypothetical protein M514_03984 [Trichuris suis]